ncbi:hypothetical protein OROGR_006729 [Orobanche gracilis]
MKRSSCTVLRPICFLILLMLMVLSAAGLLIPFWIKRVARIEDEVKLISRNTNQGLVSRIQRTSTLLFSPINASAVNLARILSSSSSLDDVNNLHFSVIESKVASTLFQALATIPYTSQVSYIGPDGLFFSYYSQGEQFYGLYSNSTFSSYGTDDYTWYIQPANRDTGKLYGEAIKSSPLWSIVNSSWFQEAINSSHGYASVGPGWSPTEDIMFLATVRMDGKKGAVSLGSSMRFFIDLLVNEITFLNGSLYLSTMDGNVLAQGIPNTRVMILSGKRVSFRLLGHGDENFISVEENITCQSDSGMFGDSALSIWSRNYIISCSPFEIAGLEMVKENIHSSLEKKGQRLMVFVFILFQVYVLAVPQNEFLSLIHKNVRLAFVLLIVMIGAAVIAICIVVYLTLVAAKREMYLCGALINQMEATRQSERKSMNKSLAFARSSHDIRASLAGITGLIEMCRVVSKKDPLRSEMLSNFQQMEACTGDLLGILNSILDTSKIESGKMQLEEEQFDVEQLLEDVVDLFHPVGNKKGVDVILDPYDGSIVETCRRVRGDRGKLKQILSNLLSNAVKFTSEGHVVVRAWVRKPSFRNASSRFNSMRCMLFLLFKVGKACSESEVMSNSVPRDPNSMEFIFEVIDTGKGIPKEKQKSVFENYVQVKETAFGQEGTGLGLGIVQSLVRLMGGEIEIVDKEVGERGTCFRFNTFFSTCETPDNSTITNNARALDIEANNNGDHISNDSFQQPGDVVRIRSPKNDGSQVLLFIQNAERSKVLQNFMKRLGIKSHVVRQHEHLSQTLKKIKQKMNLSRQSSSGTSRSEGHGSRTSSTRSKEVPLSTLDGTDDILPSPQKRPNARCGPSGFVMIVIDTRAGPFREISRAVAEFRRDLNENCYSRVVWLDKPDEGSSNFQGLDEDKLPQSDLVISKPFHGSRLYQVIGLLPEFGGMQRRGGETPPSVGKVEHRNTGSSFETGTSYVATRSGKSSFACRKCEIEEVEGSDNSCIKKLMGKKILIADDEPIARKISSSVVSQLGACVFSCENGEEAWKLVCKRLETKDLVPFDCILMDCQMPIMNGVEATIRIREAEQVYGVRRIPIIALTAHDKGEEIDSMIQAGVDGYLTKPLDKKKIMKVVSELKF